MFSLFIFFVATYLMEIWNPGHPRYAHLYQLYLDHLYDAAGIVAQHVVTSEAKFSTNIAINNSQL